MSIPLPTNNMARMSKLLWRHLTALWTSGMSVSNNNHAFLLNTSQTKTTTATTVRIFQYPHAS